MNGKRVNIPSYRLRPGDVIEVASKSKEQLRIKAAAEAAESRGFPEWLQVDSKALKTGNLGISADDPLLRDYTQLLANGTGANQASQHWHDQRTTSGNDDLDISGSLTNVFGTSPFFGAAFFA